MPVRKLPRVTPFINARVWVVDLLLVAIVALFVGCSDAVLLPQPWQPGGVTAPPLVPSPTPVPAPNVVGIWNGCIQGNASPNEIISLNVSGEQPDGSFSGIYGESFTPAGTTIVGNWQVFNAQIQVDRTLEFSSLVTSQDIIGSHQVLYRFAGHLRDDGALSGVVYRGDSAPQAWTLTNTGAACPY